MKIWEGLSIAIATILKLSSTLKEVQYLCDLTLKIDSPNNGLRLSNRQRHESLNCNGALFFQNKTQLVLEILAKDEDTLNLA